MTNLQINFEKLTKVLLCLTIFVVVLMRLQLAVTRAFDPDEFAYLHWTWLIVHGYLPYRDFFFYIIPGFPWLLSPILWLTGDSTNFLIASRIVMFIIYGSCAWMVFKMTKKITNTTPALLATLIFLTFPVTMDKTIDIRPDMVMLHLYFASAWIIFQLQRPARRQGGVKPFEAVASGMLFGASVLIFPKIIFGLPALLYLLISFTHKRFNLVGSNDNSIRPGPAWRGLAFKTRLLPWLIGASAVGLGFLGYLAFHQLVPQAIMSMTTYSLAVTAGKESFSPLLLLSPYPLIYLSAGGPSLPWAVNTGVWIVGMIGLMLLFVHPNHVSSVPDTCPSNKRMGIFWILFIAGNILFVTLFPVPYVQYLLPLSVAASVLAAYGICQSQLFVHRILSKYESRIRNYEKIVYHLTSSFVIRTSCFIIPLLLLSSFFLQYRERIAPGARNSEQLQVIGDVLRVTRPDESVYDMVGSYVFRPDGYYICCHPYAEFAHKLASGPGFDLTKSLIANKTKFLVMDRVGFVFWKSLDADKAFLLTNYLPMGNPASPGTPLSKLYSLGQSFRCQLGACVQYDMDGKPAATRSTNTFTVIATDKYTVTIEPNGAQATIDNREMDNGQIIELVAGPHGFTTGSTVKMFSYQIKRD